MIRDHCRDEAVDDRALIRLYRTASREGRLHPGIAAELKMDTGRYTCKTCGMLHHDVADADDCCTKPDRVLGFCQGANRYDHAAVLSSARALRDAVERRKADGGHSWRGMFGHDSACVQSFILRMEKNDSRFVNDRVWMALVRVFGDRVPGCVEIGRRRLQWPDGMVAR